MPKKRLNLFNRFEILNTVQVSQDNKSTQINKKEEDMKAGLSHLDSAGSRKVAKDFIKMPKRNKENFMKTREVKKKNHSKPVKIFNRFQLLEDKQNGDLQDLIRSIKIQKTPRHELKKCRKCNFKKRTCVINSSSCKSIKEVCYVCNKPGHFPNSMNCKKRRKSSMRKKDKKQSTYVKISKNDIKLIHKKIEEIEMFNLQQTNIVSQFEGVQREFEVQMISNGLVTFLSMYLFLNYDFIFPKNFVKKRNPHKDFIYLCTKEVQRRKKLKKQIVKAAKRCTQYFAVEYSKDDNATLLQFSSKIFRRILKTRSCHSPVDNKTQQMVLDIFHKIFFDDSSEEFFLTEAKFDEDGNEHISTSNQNECQIVNECIPQLDGQDKTLSLGEVPSCLYAVQNEIPNIQLWINFFRSFDFALDHLLCPFKKDDGSSCTFCHIRSSCIRLNNRGKTGPRKMKPYEAISQLGRIKCNWKDEKVDFVRFVD